MGGIASSVGGLLGIGGGGGLNPVNSFGAQTYGQDYGQLLTNTQNQYNQNMTNQNALVGQLQNQAQGTGPNLAQQQLQQATQGNINSQAAAIASQKGINPGSVARQVNEQASNANQQAAGQAGVQNAQQQLQSQGLLGGLQGQIGNQSLANQQTYENQINAGNNIAAGVAGQNATTGAQIAGGVMSGIGAVAGLAHGGMVPNYDLGGSVFMPYTPPSNQMASPVATPTIQNQSGPSSYIGKALGAQQQGQAQNGQQPKYTPGEQIGRGSDQLIGAGIGGLKSLFSSSINPAASGGGMDSLGDGLGSQIADSPGLAQLSYKGGEIKLPPLRGAIPMKQGGGVPGKAKVSGNSIKNDTVPAVLSPGEVVIPRSVMQSADPAAGAAAFVQHVLSKKVAR